MTAAFCWGFAAGVVLLIVLDRAGRNTYRSAAFYDAASFLRQAAAQKRWAGCVIAPKVLEAYAERLEAWAKNPEGGRENMPPVPDVPEIGFLRDGTRGRR